jgi:ketosteroid isomerase-like protein
MTPEQIAKLVDDMYAMTSVGDFDGAEAYLADDLIITEANGLPMEGVYRGKGALRALYGKVMGMMDVAGLERVALTVGGDYAICVVRFQFVDPTIEGAELCELFRFNAEGKVAEIKPYYFDPAPMIAAAKAKAATTA